MVATEQKGTTGLLQRSKSWPCSDNNNFTSNSASPRVERSGKRGRSTRQAPVVGQARSLAGILLMVVTLSTFGVTTTLRNVLLKETASRLQQQLEDHHPLSGRRRRNLRNLKSVPITGNNNFRSAPASSTGTRSMLEQPQPPSASTSYWHVLSFGSEVTYGSGLQNKTSQAYPYLLDPETVLSAALPSGHWYADLAAACTQTMVSSGEEKGSTAATAAMVYSLVTIEYYEISDSHIVLIQRLRRRFPMAVIVLVRILQPATQLVLETRTATPLTRSDSIGLHNNQNLDVQLAAVVNQLSFAEWKARREDIQGISADDRTHETLFRLVSSMMQEAAATGGVWKLSPIETDTRVTSLLHRDRLVLHQQTAVPLDFALMQDLEDFLRMYNYQGDATLLSVAGHEAVADSIRKRVESSDLLSLKSLQSSSVVGDWGSGDDCHVWYATGNYNLESTGLRVNLPIHEQSRKQRKTETGLPLSLSLRHVAAKALGTHKHALEFHRFTPMTSAASTIFTIFRSIGTTISSTITSSTGTAPTSTNNQITVHNPFDHDRLLSLTYLTDSDSMSYPKTRVVVNGAPTVLLQPFHDRAQHDEALSSRHVARTSGVGFVPPGTSTVLLEPLQSTTLPFRLLGASLLAEEVQNLPSIEFALETDSMEALDDDAMVATADVHVGRTSSQSTAGLVSRLLLMWR